ncbi:PilN domain-containing protein [Vibrio sp. MA40-2]|uniref:PilN domain-containing protein n=1 Tax=Vibrio sp. MA40-2 TaxID=3391828 RepID=UPI0039A60A24
MLTNINFLPWRETNLHYRKRRLYLLSVISLIFSALVQGWLHHNVSQQSVHIQRSIVELETMGVSVDKQRALTVQLQAEQAVLDEQLTRIRSLENNKYSMMLVFNLLGILLPEGLVLDSVSKNSDRVYLSGFSYQADLIDELVNNLKHSHQLSNVEIQSMFTRDTHPVSHYFALLFSIKKAL